MLSLFTGEDMSCQLMYQTVIVLSFKSWIGWRAVWMEVGRRRRKRGRYSPKGESERTAEKLCCSWNWFFRKRRREAGNYCYIPSRLRWHAHTCENTPAHTLCWFCTWHTHTHTHTHTHAHTHTHTHTHFCLPDSFLLTLHERRLKSVEITFENVSLQGVFLPIRVAKLALW